MYKHIRKTFFQWIRIFGTNLIEEHPKEHKYITIAHHENRLPADVKSKQCYKVYPVYSKQTNNIHAKNRLPADVKSKQCYKVYPVYSKQTNNIHAIHMIVIRHETNFNIYKTLSSWSYLNVYALIELTFCQKQALSKEYMQVELPHIYSYHQLLMPAV